MGYTVFIYPTGGMEMIAKKAVEKVAEKAVEKKKLHKA
jgi:hypothetical protein